MSPQHRKVIEPDRGLLVAAYKTAGAQFHQIAFLAQQYVSACERGHAFLAQQSETKLRRKLVRGT